MGGEIAGIAILDCNFKLPDLKDRRQPASAWTPA
jgi:hypothetical protein